MEFYGGMKMQVNPTSACLEPESLSNPAPTTQSWDPSREIISNRREQEDLSVSPRWRRPLGYYALQDSRGNYVREAGGEVVAFRGPRMRENAVSAAMKWKERRAARGFKGLR